MMNEQLIYQVWQTTGSLPKEELFAAFRRGGDAITYFDTLHAASWGVAQGWYDVTVKIVRDGEVIKSLTRKKSR
jgi:hypothetical protein